jgi:ferrous iron transport protein B
MSSLAAPPLPKTVKVALIGNPNTGKSTLFNALAGLHARVGNYPGVTVEKKIGRVRWAAQSVHLIDLPGTYSLSPRSLDEAVSVDVLLGLQKDIGPLDAIICIADASNLERHFFLLGQLLDIGVPVVLVLNMWDTAETQGLRIDVERLRDRLGIPVVVTEAHRHKGIDAVREAALSVAGHPPRHQRPRLFPEGFYAECDALAKLLAAYGQDDVPYFLLERLLLDAGGSLERRYAQHVDQLASQLTAARQRLKDSGCAIPWVEAERRFAWARELLRDVVTTPARRVVTWTDRIDALLTHRVAGVFVFATLMFVVFQAIYAWAAPLMDACKGGQVWLAGQVTAYVAPGPLRSLLVDGVVAGVGGVVVFVPQIMLLFFFIALLEDCGYMARVAYMMDRVMSWFGLSGKSFLPLMSSFACAVPGIMATRVIDSHRDRMVTILVAPLMSCSARLPVYSLLIAAFIPAHSYLNGWLSLQGLVLFGMSSLGVLVAIPVAWLLTKTFFRGQPSLFVMELPMYKVPSPRLVGHRVYDRSMAFIARAGTLIFATTILVWAAGYFPASHAALNQLDAQIEELESSENGVEESQLAPLKEQRNQVSAELMSRSVLGRAGQAIEPVVRPLGWDWKIGVSVIASFPAREVVIGTLGTIYSLGGEVDEESKDLEGALQAATWPDGRPVYGVPVALSLMVFFALCAQCASTLVIMRRETNSWRWPVFCFVYMTALAYVGAWATYQAAMAIAAMA